MIVANRYARVSLYGKGVGWIDLKDKSLPLSEEERAIIKDVQGVDDKVQAYLRQHYNDPIKVADIKGLEGCVLYPMAAVVVNGDGSKVRYFCTGYQNGYYMDKGRNYLHRVVALQVLRVADPEKYRAVMRHPEKFEVHHLNPDMKSDKRVGNNALHVKVIEKEKHKKYTAIVRKIYNLKELYNIKLLKYEFYKMINNKRVARMGELRDLLAKKDTKETNFLKSTTA